MWLKDGVGKSPDIAEVEVELLVVEERIVFGVLDMAICQSG